MDDLVERLRGIPDRHGIMYQDYEDVMKAADRIQALEARIAELEYDLARHVDSLAYMREENGRVRARLGNAMIEGAERMREAAVKAIKTDAGKCDCHARSEEECVCGAWDGYKTVQSSAMVEIVSALSPASILRDKG